MTKEQVEAALKEIGISYNSVYTTGIREPHGYQVSLLRDRSVCVNYDELARLSAMLGTTKINFEFDAGSEDYSELTPGDPVSVTMFIEP